MRNAMPMRWIEQREARQVLASSRFERPPTPPWSGAQGLKARDAAPDWLPRLGAWLAARHPIGWLAAQAKATAPTLGGSGPKMFRKKTTSRKPTIE